MPQIQVETLILDGNAPGGFHDRIRKNAWCTHAYIKYIVIPVMVASIKTLYDLFAEFLRERAHGKREVFENYSTPLYEGAKKVFDDYLAVFADMKKMALKDKSLQKLADFIDERRHATLSTRHQLRAFIHEFGGHTSTGRPDLPAFERAILGILEGAFEIAHSLGYFRRSLHEQMSLESRFERERRDKPSRALFLKQFVREIDGQVHFLEAEFKTVADEYAAMQANLTPTYRLKRKDPA